MLVGIIIGIVMWQMVVGIALMLDYEYEWWIAPIFNLGLWLVERMVEIISNIREYQFWFYLFKCGIHPWKKLSLAELKNKLTVKQQKTLVSKIKNPKVQNKFKLVFFGVKNELGVDK